MTRRPPPGVLTIAGSDSGSGAGLQADLRAIQALGSFGFCAVTAITAQNTRGVASWRPVAPALIEAQIEAVLSDFSVGAMKTGLLPGPAAIRAVARALRKRPRIPLVVDPVIGSTSGTRFLSPAGVIALARELLPLATLVTPNWPEAEALSGLPVRTFEEAEAAARALLDTGCAAVLVKGGHGPGPRCRDVLAQAGGRIRWFEGLRISTRNSHGTGCVLSAAIAAGLADSKGMDAAIAGARRLLCRGLWTGKQVRWGDGSGPTFSGVTAAGKRRFG